MGRNSRASARSWAAGYPDGAGPLDWLDLVRPAVCDIHRPKFSQSRLRQIPVSRSTRTKTCDLRCNHDGYGDARDTKNCEYQVLGQIMLLFLISEFRRAADR